MLTYRPSGLRQLLGLLMLLLLVPGSRPASGAEDAGQVYGKQSRGEVIFRLASEHTRGFAPILPDLDYEAISTFTLHVCPDVGLFVPVCDASIAAPAWQGSRMIRGPPQL